MVAIYEGWPSRKSVASGDRPSVDVTWIVLGTRDDLFVKAFVLAFVPTTYDGLYRGPINFDEVAPEVWECVVRYEARKPPESGDCEWSFDTTGGRAKITQAKEHIHDYAPGEETAPNYKGAIGVTDDSVEGCEIVVPEFKWTETWQLPRENVTWGYAQTVKSLSGKTNSAPFRGIPAGQVRFDGARGGVSKKNPAVVELTFHFAQGEDVENQNVGDITGIAKKAWEYLWVRYRKKEDTSAKTLVDVPSSAHVERVYDSGNFASLGIGTDPI